MQRRRFIAAALSAALLAGQALAGTIQDEIVRELSAQGFTRVSISKTFLGRIRFVATSAQFRREIIVNGRTGEILRDYTTGLADGATAPPRLSDPHDGGTNSNGDDNGSHDNGGDDDNDDDEDDDDDRDEQEDRSDDRDEGDSDSGGGGGGDDDGGDDD